MSEEYIKISIILNRRKKYFSLLQIDIIKNLKNTFSGRTTVLLLVFPSELDVDIHPWMNSTTKLCPMPP